MSVIARMAGVSRSLIYRVIRGITPLTPAVKERLESVLEAIDGGTVKIERVGQVWGGDYRDPPAVMPPPQDKMVRAEDWNEWARCRSCAGRAWTRVTLHGTKAHWYLCDGCLWWETAGMGARRV